MGDKTDNFQERENKHVDFMFTFVGVLIGLLALFLTTVRFGDYKDDAVYLKDLFLLAVFSLASCLLFGFCVMSGPIFKDSSKFNFMSYNTAIYNKKVKKCLSLRMIFLVSVCLQSFLLLLL